MWPICALNVAENGLNCGKKVAKSGQNRAKIGQKTGKKWPILSRMGELLKGTFLAVFGLILSRILSFLDPPGGAPGGPYEPHMACIWVYTDLCIACSIACYIQTPQWGSFHAVMRVLLRLIAGNRNWWAEPPQYLWTHKTPNPHPSI